MAGKSRPCFEAKRKVEELQEFANILNMKVYSEKTDLVLPKTSMVEIVDTAVPAMRPFRPNKMLNFWVGFGIGGVPGVILSALSYVLQVRSFSLDTASLRVRLVTDILIAAPVAVLVGWFCAGPQGSLIVIGLQVVLLLLIGGSILAHMEIANWRGGFTGLREEFPQRGPRPQEHCTRITL